MDIYAGIVNDKYEVGEEAKNRKVFNILHFILRFYPCIQSNILSPIFYIFENMSSYKKLILLTYKQNFGRR